MRKCANLLGKDANLQPGTFFSFTCANKIALLQIEAFNLLSVRIHIIKRNIFFKEKKTGSHSENGNLGRMLFQLHNGYVSFSFLFYMWFTDSPNKLCVNINRPV